MNDIVYFLIVRTINWLYWRGNLLGAENLPDKGPAVFVANHIGPRGPIGAVCTIRLRFYPWIIADMVDKRLAPDYLRVDFVEPSLKLKPPLSRAVARALSLLSVPMLTYLGCVPVNRGNYDDVQDTLLKSIVLLKEGKFVLVFPEEPALELDPETNMKPFLKGFTRLGEHYYDETGEILSFYPLAVHQSKKVMLGKPLLFNPDHPRGLERHRLKDELESVITELYLTMETGGSSS